jgi:hypothetical protein
MTVFTLILSNSIRIGLCRHRQAMASHIPTLYSDGVVGAYGPSHNIIDIQCYSQDLPWSTSCRYYSLDCNHIHLSDSHHFKTERQRWTRNHSKASIFFWNCQVRVTMHARISAWWSLFNSQPIPYQCNIQPRGKASLVLLDEAVACE